MRAFHAPSVAVAVAVAVAWLRILKLVIVSDDSWQTNFIWFTPDGGKPVDPGWHGCAQYIQQCNASQLAIMETYHEKFVAKLTPVRATS